MQYSTQEPRRDAHLLFLRLGIKLDGGKTTEILLTHGHCNARPTVSFPPTTSRYQIIPRGNTDIKVQTTCPRPT